MTWMLSLTFEQLLIIFNYLIIRIAINLFSLPPSDCKTKWMFLRGEGGREEIFSATRWNSKE